MRFLPTLTRSAVAGAAVVLLTACGGSGDGEPAATSSSPSPATSSSAEPTTAAPTSPDAEAAAFCAEVSTVFEQVSTAFETATPEQVPGLLDEVVAGFDTVQPPAEIQGDWQALGDALRQLAQVADSVDLTTPEGQQQYAQAETEITGQVQQAQTNVTNYVLANCGAAAPSS